jgi:malate synthase
MTIELTKPGPEQVFTREALAFLEELHRTFDGRRQELLQKRVERYRKLESGAQFEFLPETAGVRSGDWRVAPVVPDLARRHVEITGPVERKMMINALNSGADVFMSDFEDSLSPTWSNVAQGHLNLIDAVRRKLTFTSPEGKSYRLNEKIATLLVRPRGWHLTEKHILVDQKPVSGSLADFGLFFFHNARETLDRGTGPYFYLPKIESHLEARLWNEVFVFAQDRLKIPRGSVRATVLIETLPAAFEMDEILYELREHSSGLNAGRWDYIFSLIKKFRTRKDLILPDRQKITMTVPFMRAYTELLVKTCHKRGAHAMGGMAPFIPTRKNPEVNEKALAQTRADKEREVNDGFDGTWVAHPDLVPIAKEVFDKKLGRPNQLDRQRPEVDVKASELQDTRIPGATISEAGMRNSISVGVQYIASWLGGNGAAAIYNLMEDAATAEISRALLWQWVQNKARLEDGRTIDRKLYEQFRDDEVGRLSGTPHLQQAQKIVDDLVLGEFVDFLTLPAYSLLE